MNKIELAAIDLNLLVVLDVLLDSASVTASARRLGRTQSAVSHALARLRELFDDPLLVRVGAGMQPTPRAAGLREPLAELLRCAEGLVRADAPFDPASASLRLRISASDYLQIVFVLPVLARLRERAPGIDVEIRGPQRDYPRALAVGEIDLACGVGPQPEHLHTLALGSDHFVSVLGPRAKRTRSLSLERFVAAPHALVSPSAKPGSFVDEVLRELGRTRRVAVILPDFLTALRLARDSELIVTLPERVVAAAGDPSLRRYAPPIELPTLALSLVWHERVAHTPAITWVRELFGEIAAELEQAKPRTKSK